MPRYIITPGASREFDKELDYSEQRWGKRHAKKYAEELMAKVASVADSPWIYREQPDIMPGMRICIHKGNRIVFTVKEDSKQVVILAFLSIYQDLNPATLRKRML